MMARIRLLLGICVILMLVVTAPISLRSAQAATTTTPGNILDPGFKPVIATPGTIRGIVPLADSKMLVYGSFTSLAGVACSGIAVLKPDGTVDPGFNLATELLRSTITPIIETVALVTGGKILVGGQLAWNASDYTQMYLFRLNPDGSLDPTFNAGGFNYSTFQPYGLDGVVRVIYVDGNGRILVGGDFTVPYNHITRLNPNGDPDPTFDPSSGSDGPVEHIQMQSGGQIILAGEFTSVGGVATQGVARLGPNGAVDGSFFGAGVSGGILDTRVSSLLVMADDSVLVAGTFSDIKGEGALTLARLTPAGIVDSAFTPAARDYLAEVTSLLVVGNTLIAGGWNPYGWFGNYPLQHKAWILLMQATTGAFINVERFNGQPTDVLALAKRSDGKVLAGGSFTIEDEPEPQYYPGLFLFTPSPFTIVTGFKPIVGGQPGLTGVGARPDGKIIAAGSFYRVNGAIYNGLASLNPDGSLDSAFTPVSTQTNQMALRADGKIVGSGSYPGDFQGGDLALIATDGSILARGVAGPVTHLVVQPDNKVLVATSHSPGVARYTDTLTLDTIFESNRGSGISNSFGPDNEIDRVNSVALQGTDVIVGGSILSFSDKTVKNLVRLKADGSFDDTFVQHTFSEFFFRSEVFALAVQTDGKILVGGRFTSVDGMNNTTSLVRLNPDGSLDASFHSSFQGFGDVYALALQPDGKILVGGPFLVRLGQDGSQDTSFNANVHGAVHSLVFEAPATVLLGGSFDAVDGIPRQGLARYTVTLAMPTLESNYASGAPGSFFTLSATNLPSDSDVTLSVNGHDLGGDHTDGNGAATLILDAADATPGPYFCKLIWGGDGTGQAAVQSEGEVLVLIQVSPAAPLRAKEGDASVIAIPGGINGSQVMLPLIFR